MARLVSASGRTASMWSVGGGFVQSALAAATACLPADVGRQNLGESDVEGRHTYTAANANTGGHERAASP